MSAQQYTFYSTYSPEHGQYVAQAGEVVVVPTRFDKRDDAKRRADALCVALNRVYTEREDVTRVPETLCPNGRVARCAYPACSCPLAYVPVDRWFAYAERVTCVRCLQDVELCECDTGAMP